MFFSHLGIIALVLALFAIVFACFTRGPGDL